MGHVDLGGTWHESSYRLVETYDVTVGPAWTSELDPQPYGEVVLVQDGRLRAVPPMTYLQAMRLSGARVALARTTQTTAAIAAAHGFADAAHFSRAFKRQYGVAPTPFRQRLRSNASSADSILPVKPLGVWDKHRDGFATDDETLRKESHR